MVNKTRSQDLKTIGQWTWNSRLLNSKVIEKGINDCWPATNFAQTEHAPLFGAIKNGRRQMSQATRILYRDWYNEDCEDLEITHSCGNKNCINKNHWEIVEIKTHGPKPTNVPQGQLKPVSKGKNKRWWDEL